MAPASRSSSSATRSCPASSLRPHPPPGRSRTVLDRVLVPLDGSETAERVLPHLRRLLLGRSAEIIVLRVLDATSPDLSVMAPALEAEAERYVRRITFQLMNEGRRARSIIRPGGAAATILRVAREEQV